MSLQFNDTNTLKGLVQMYERELGFDRAVISGNTNKLKEFTADVNLAIDDYVSLMIQSSGFWKGDDTNHSDYPEIYTDIVSGQRDYTFITDENGNHILDIYKVYYKDGNTYKLLSSYDSDSEMEVSTFTDGLNSTGIPSKYDKTANAIRLDMVPNTNITNGLKVSINREGSYFTYTDTTKKPGFPGIHHKYFFLKPALEYARRNTLTSYPRIEGEIMKLERDIKEYFDRRAKDERQTLHINTESTR